MMDELGAAGGTWATNQEAMDDSGPVGDYATSETDQFSDGGDGDNPRGPRLREQDRFLPIANVNRIMKMSVPKSGKIAKDAKECVQECVSEFVSFITSEASDKCINEKRKTITGDDILFAMQTLGFDHYIEPLTQYLNKFRDHNRTDKPMSQPQPQPQGTRVLPPRVSGDMNQSPQLVQVQLSNGTMVLAQNVQFQNPQ